MGKTHSVYFSLYQCVLYDPHLTNNHNYPVRADICPLILTGELRNKRRFSNFFELIQSIFGWNKLKFPYLTT